MPWYKQLVAHEYRHAVQYNNLEPRRDPRPELYPRAAGLDHRPALHADLGHGGRRRDVRRRPCRRSAAGLAALVLAGLPRHGARGGAISKDARDRRNIDKWFCGSYRDYIPDHYELGYQICSYAYERYGEVRLGQGGAATARATPMCWPRRASRSKNITAPMSAGFSARRSTRWSGTGSRCPGRGQRRAADADARRQLHDLPVAAAAQTPRRRWRSRPTTTVRRVSCGSTPARAKRR